MPKRRSPNYPALSFPGALKYAEDIYDETQLHKTDRESLARIIGYKGLSGKSLSVLGSLKAYGLLEGSGQQVGLSRDAETILVDPDSSGERTEAIIRCSFAPAIFAQINEDFAGSLPDDQLLRAYLLKKGYSQQAVIRVTEVFKDTFAFIERIDSEEKREEGQYTNFNYKIKNKVRENNEIRDSNIYRSQGSHVPGLPGYTYSEKEIFSYKLEPSGSFRLVVDGDVDIEEVLDILEDLVALKKKELQKKKKPNDK